MFKNIKRVIGVFLVCMIITIPCFAKGSVDDVKLVATTKEGVLIMVDTSDMSVFDENTTQSVVVLINDKTNENSIFDLVINDKSKKYVVLRGLFYKNNKLICAISTPTDPRSYRGGSYYDEIAKFVRNNTKQ